MDTAICFENVSRKFTLHHERPRSFQELAVGLFRRNNSSREEFWALRDVSFTVEKGETVGLIGPNGAGKSTVLKLVSRIIEPSAGRLQVKGRIGALLELGAGFHPDLTGRENIYLNGSILGLGRAEIERKLDEIIEFAEIGRFIDAPVKHYSSGMFMRLGFAVATHISPDILLIDEVLAVGDQNFQSRCLEKIAGLHRQGITIVLVSHDLNMVRDLCSRVMWMEDGRQKMDDLAEPVIAAYLHRIHETEKIRLEQENKEQAQLLEAEPVAEPQENAPHRYGNGRIRITSVEMIGADGQKGWVFQSGERVRVHLHYETKHPVENPVFSILIHRDDGLYVTSSNTYQRGGATRIGRHGCVEVEFPSIELARGTYMLSTGAYVAPDPPFWSDPADFHDRAYQFKIESEWQFHGVVAPQTFWRIVREDRG